MVYIALLRGINVGGNNKVPMARLKETFEHLGFEAVKTFIASGNVIFRTDSTDEARLTAQIEQAIEQDFGFHVSVLLRDFPSIEKLVAELPDDWVNDQTTRGDVLFLWPDIDNPNILEQLPHKPEIEEMRYFPGAVAHRIARANATKSSLPKIIGTPIYKKITIRNPNTVRKLLALMQAANQ